MTTDSKSELVVIDGARSPFVRAGQDFAELQGRDLARLTLMHLLQGREQFRLETELLAVATDRQSQDDIDEARHIALSSEISESIASSTIALGPGAGLLSLSRLMQSRDSGESGLFIDLAYGSTSQALGLAPNSREDRSLRRRAQSRAEVVSHSSLNHLKIAEKLAAELDIDRLSLDAHADQSRRMARMHTLQNRADIVPVVTATDLIKDDCAAHEDENLDWLLRLKPLAKADGRITAGNSQVPADGAACLLLARRRALPEGETALVTLKRDASFAGSIRLGALAILGALSRLLEGAELKLEDIDLFEIHESCAADLLAILRVSNSERLWQHYALPGTPLGMIREEALNIWGGASALGHVTAATDLRMTLSLARQLENRGLRRGIVAQFQGAGQATALLLERD